MLAPEEARRCLQWVAAASWILCALPQRYTFCCDPNHKLFSNPAGALETTCLGNGPGGGAGSPTRRPPRVERGRGKVSGRLRPLPSSLVPTECQISPAGLLGGQPRHGPAPGRRKAGPCEPGPELEAGSLGGRSRVRPGFHPLPPRFPGPGSARVHNIQPQLEQARRTERPSGPRCFAFL